MFYKMANLIVIREALKYKISITDFNLTGSISRILKINFINDLFKVIFFFISYFLYILHICMSPNLGTLTLYLWDGRFSSAYFCATWSDKLQANNIGSKWNISQTRQYAYMYMYSNTSDN